MSTRDGTGTTGAVDRYRARREALLEDASLVGRRWCDAAAAATDDLFSSLFADAVGGRDAATSVSGVSLVAVGGYGRGDLCPGSDLDVLLLHDGRDDARTKELAEALWYPIWDTGLKLGHSVRTAREALSLAADDLDTATSLLTMRHLAGDRSLTAPLAESAEALWQKRAKRYRSEVGERVRSRHAAAGEVAFLLEPDLKESRGGLRDVHVLAWTGRWPDTELLSLDAGALARAEDVLLNVRVELHRRTGRQGPSADVLLLQEQDGVARALGQPSADELMRWVSEAGRTIAWIGADTWRRLTSAPGWRERRGAQDLGGGVETTGTEVRLVDEADPASDPVLVLRVAAEAARLDLPIERDTLQRLTHVAPLPDPWPDEARRLLVALLGAGRPAIEVFEALDHHDLVRRLVSEWEPCRSKPQRNAYHRFTVDRHLCEAAAEASRHTRDVSRPDLLLVGAWLHDIGKGYPGDHTEVGMDLIDGIARRMGFDDDDVAVLVAMCEHHLLLPDVATRRDLDDDGTIAGVATAAGSTLVLELLHGLTKADSVATGPAAWSAWKAGLVETLVRRADHVLRGGAVADVTADTPLTDELERLVDAGRLEVRVDEAPEGHDVVVVCPDRPGIMWRVTGVLALHGLDVLRATIWSGRSMAVEIFRVASAVGEPDTQRLAEHLRRALTGRLAIDARLAERSRTYRPAGRQGAADRPEPHVIVDNRATDAATVVEVRAADSVGMLSRLCRALSDLEVNIASAKVQTLGDAVVDTFYVTVDGDKMTDDVRIDELTRALVHAVEPVEGAR